MKSNIKFILAIILILASFVIAVMSYYMLPICIPIFVVGIILLWFSKAKSRSKILWTVLPILFYLPSSFIFLYLYNYSSEKTVQLPAHYSGNFYIIYNQPCGESIPGNFLKKQIHIPEDGILIVKNKREGGFLNYRFIHSNSSAVREEILLIGIKPGGDPEYLRYKYRF